jgi:hypothetical protein
MCTTSDIAARELDHRTGDGIDVTLCWNAGANRLIVAVQDERDGDSFDVEVDAAEALDAFHHPLRMLIGAAPTTSRWPHADDGGT